MAKKKNIDLLIAAGIIPAGKKDSFSKADRKSIESLTPVEVAHIIKAYAKLGSKFFEANPAAFFF